MAGIHQNMLLYMYLSIIMIKMCNDPERPWTLRSLVDDDSKKLILTTTMNEVYTRYNYLNFLNNVIFVKHYKIRSFSSHLWSTSHDVHNKNIPKIMTANVTLRKLSSNIENMNDCSCSILFACMIDVCFVILLTLLCTIDESVRQKSFLIINYMYMALNSLNMLKCDHDKSQVQKCNVLKNSNSPDKKIDKMVKKHTLVKSRSRSSSMKWFLIQKSNFSFIFETTKQVSQMYNFDRSRSESGAENIPKVLSAQVPNENRATSGMTTKLCANFIKNKFKGKLKGKGIQLMQINVGLTPTYGKNQFLINLNTEKGPKFEMTGSFDNENIMIIFYSIIPVGLDSYLSKNIQWHQLTYLH